MFVITGVSWDFALIGIHVKPDDAVAEIDGLLDVYDDVRRKWTDIQVRFPLRKHAYSNIRC